MQRVFMKAMRYNNDTLAALKWVALLLMVIDHTNKYLLNSTYDSLFVAGRLALPIFAFVLAYNLARPSTFVAGAYRRTMGRLAVFGALASIPYVGMGNVYYGWWPLNVMFSLLVITATIYCIERRTPWHWIGAAALFGIGGLLVEYQWQGIAMGVASWIAVRYRSSFALLTAIGSCAGLASINGTHAALLAVPILAAALYWRLDWHVPRCKWTFYIVYPLHLCILWLIRIPMSKAGYVFF